MRHPHTTRHISAVVLSALLVLCFQPDTGEIAFRVAVVAQEASSTGTVPAGKFRLRYHIEGAGTPAIVVGSAIYYPRVFSKNLRRHLRLVFLDHRGFAPSPGRVDTSEFELDMLLDDIERARRQLGLGRIAIIGHSGHALMALEYAKKYPANVSHVVMIGITPSLSLANRAAAERYWQEFASPERKALMDEKLRRLPDEKVAQLPLGEQLNRRYIRDAPRIWYSARFDATPLFEDVEFNPDMYNYVWGQVFRDIDITRGLEKFDRPVFLALGRYDFLLAPPSVWDSLKPKFRNLTVRVFEQSGHTPQYEEADRFDAELLRWMQGHP